MTLKLEDFAGSEAEPMAALIIDLAEWMEKRKAPVVEATGALCILTGMLSARAGLSKQATLEAARLAVTAGAILEIVDQIKELK